MANSSDILYVKGMHLTESEGEDEGEDIWDDRKLNDAYDKALSIANAEVAKRVAMSTNNQNKQGQSSNKKHQKSNNKSRGSRKEHLQWKTGMPCRAVYEVDGNEYEAFISRIINDKECVVRFIGYENSEIVSIDTLKPTLGTDERKRQIEQALEDKADEAYTSQPEEKMDCISDRATSPNSTEKSFQRKKSAKKKKTPHTRHHEFELPDMPFPMPPMPGMRNFNAMAMPLPPPPPLPLSDRSDSEDQAISSMLLSWYMSGYYTGLYQGLKRAKEGRRNV